MNFEVIWKTVALDHLADVYVSLSVADRNRMANGIEGLNRRLADEPLEVGESRFSGIRIAFPALLTVTFHVDEPKRIVRVLGLARYGR